MSTKLNAEMGVNMTSNYNVQLIKETIEENGFNGVVLIEEDNHTILAEGYGMANFEHDIMNDVHTKFRIASITKQMTAMAILQLYDKNLLNLSDTIDQFIPDYPQGHKISIHHLLTHTSGISNFALEYDFYDVLHSEPVLLALIDLFKFEPLQFEPGERFSYSISGFLLLGYIIERLTGLKYENYLQKYIFEPIGMHHSGFDHYRDIVKKRASGYDLVDGLIRNAEFIDMRIAGAGGGLYSTVGDLQLFNKAIKAGEIISLEASDLMFKNQFEIAEDVYSGYGIFLQSCEYFGKKRLKQYHTGGGIGVRSINIYLPDDLLKLTVISNVNDRDTFNNTTNDIERILLEV